MTPPVSEPIGPHGPLLAIYQRWLQSGSDADWDAFAQASRKPILSSIYRAASAWTRPAPDLLEDLAQETYLNLCLRNRSALRGLRGETPQELIAYLRVCAHNVVQDHFRAQMAEKRGGGKDTIAINDHLPELKPASELVERKLLLDSIGRCLSGNADRDRAIFWLYFRDGLTALDISKIPALGLGQKGVESAILRLVKGVRDCVKGKSPSSPSSQKGATA